MPQGSPHPILAKRFLDFCASQTPLPTLPPRLAAFPQLTAIQPKPAKNWFPRFLTLDFRQAAIEKKTITDQWQKHRIKVSPWITNY